MTLFYGLWIQQIGESCHITTPFLETDGHIFRGVDVEFKDIGELSWCRVISSTPYKQTDSAMIIDAMDLLYTSNIDGFCLVTSDSDFTRLASRLREAGKIGRAHV